MLLNPHIIKSLNSIERILPRMMCAAFNGKINTKIISCYNPTNIQDEMDITTFYNALSFLVWHIPKHNVLITSGNMNAQIGKNINMFCLHNSPNRNGEFWTDFQSRFDVLTLNSKKGQKSCGLRFTLITLSS